MKETTRKKVLLFVPVCNIQKIVVVYGFLYDIISIILAHLAHSP